MVLIALLPRLNTPHLYWIRDERKYRVAGGGRINDVITKDNSHILKHRIIFTLFLDLTSPNLFPSFVNFLMSSISLRLEKINFLVWDEMGVRLPFHPLFFEFPSG